MADRGRSPPRSFGDGGVRGGGGRSGGRRRDRRDETRSLHCRGYNVAKTLPEDLREVFKKFGKVIDVYLPRDYYTDKLRGFAYIQFEDENDAEKARLALDRTEIFNDGNVCAVMWASGKRKTPNDMQRIDVERDNPHARERLRSVHDRPVSPRGPPSRGFSHRDDRDRIDDYSRVSRSPDDRGFGGSRHGRRDALSPSRQRRSLDELSPPSRRRNSSPPYMDGRGRDREPRWSRRRSVSPSPPRYRDVRDHSRSPPRVRRRYETYGDRRVLSPDVRRSLSPRPRRRPSPDSRRRFSPDPRHLRSPSSRRSYPTDKRRVSPHDGRSPSPEYKRMGSPGQRRMRSPGKRRSVSPTQLNAASPDLRRPRSPPSRRTFSPGRKQTCSPRDQRSVSPAPRVSNSRRGQRSLSPDGAPQHSPGTRQLSPSNRRHTSPGLGFDPDGYDQQNDLDPRQHSPLDSRRRSISPGRERDTLSNSRLRRSPGNYNSARKPSSRDDNERDIGADDSDYYLRDGRDDVNGDHDPYAGDIDSSSGPASLPLRSAPPPQARSTGITSPSDTIPTSPS